MIARTLYNLLLPLALGAARVSSWFLPKMREAVAGRRGFRERWRGLGSEPGERPVWFHVSSVGEFEQARPVITLVAERYPDIPVIVTFSSPSGYRFAARRMASEASTIRFFDYLPADTIGNMRFCLDAARPRLLVLVKFDIWPNLVWETKARDIPIVLIAATLSPGSRRNDGAARRFYASLYRSFDAILAISDSDAERFRATVPDHARIAVTGDTRFDRVAQRWADRAATPVPFERGADPVVIAGSTWPPDEAHLLGALRRLLEEHAGLRVMIAPHEPTPEHIEPLEAWARGAGLACRRLTAGSGGSEARVVIVDTVGVLAEAYRLGDIAYVGGGFTTGVHSVIEPAIAGLPVLFGPHHTNSFEAVQLAGRGAGFCVTDERTIYERLSMLLNDASARQRAGDAARAYVESQLGASEKCMAVVAEFL